MYKCRPVVELIEQNRGMADFHLADAFSPIYYYRAAIAVFCFHEGGEP